MLSKSFEISRKLSQKNVRFSFPFYFTSLLESNIFWKYIYTNILLKSSVIQYRTQCSLFDFFKYFIWSLQFFLTRNIRLIEWHMNQGKLYYFRKGSCNLNKRIRPYGNTDRNVRYKIPNHNYNCYIIPKKYFYFFLQYFDFIWFFFLL